MGRLVVYPCVCVEEPKDYDITISLSDFGERVVLCCQCCRMEKTIDDWNRSTALLWRLQNVNPHNGEPKKTLTDYQREWLEKILKENE